MFFHMPGESWIGPLDPPNAEELAVRGRLVGHVDTLAGRIGERNIWQSDALESAAQFIEQTLRELDYEPAAQHYMTEGQRVRNIEAELPGASPLTAREIVIAGAHYDSLIGTVGANDNASGVAAVLEMARLLRGRSLPRTVRFVLFVNEEPPFFQSEQMGSRHYARRCRERGEQIIAMLTPETIGCYSDEPGSQRYPIPFARRLGYPDQGNFLAFVGNVASRRLVRQAIASFRRHTRFPSEGIAAPELITGIGWSDHWSFWQEGYPAIMLTDTAPYRYPHYHQITDTPDKIDYDRTARVTAGIARIVEELATQ